MKKVCLLLILVLLLGCFAGCQAAPVEGTALTDSQKNEIEAAWRNAHTGDFPGWYDRDSHYTHGLVYCGTDNGYHILLLSPENYLNWEDSKTFAGKTFQMPHSFSMYAFKYGEFTDLYDAYNNGHVSDEGIAQAFEMYMEYFRSAYPQLLSYYGYE